jgi:hypothetical protein
MTTTAEELTAGTVMTSDQVRDLTVGASVTYTPTGTVWTKHTNKAFASSAGGHCALVTMCTRAAEGKVTLAQLPEEATGLDVDTTIETSMTGVNAEMSLAEFKQLFGTVAMGGQQTNGVNFNTVQAALKKLGIESLETGEGAYVAFGDKRLVGEMPPNTLLTTRTAPSDADHIVFRVSEAHELQFLMGYERYDQYTILKVLTHPEGEKASWLSSDSEPDAEELLKFKKKAWQITREVKGQTGWCGVLEDIVKRAGVTAEVESVELPSKALKAEEVAALPVGTVLRYASLGSSSSVLYVRDDSADNPAKTRKIGGTMDGSWVQSGAIVVREHGNPMRITVHSREEMGSMPTGTVVCDSGRNRWRRMRFTASGRTARDWRLPDNSYDYNYCPNDFSIGTLYYETIPGV